MSTENVENNFKCLCCCAVKYKNNYITPLSFSNKKFCVTPFCCNTETCSVNPMYCFFKNGCNCPFLCKNTNLLICPFGCNYKNTKKTTEKNDHSFNDHITPVCCYFEDGCNNSCVCKNTKLMITPLGCLCDEGCITPLGCVYSNDAKKPYNSVYFSYFCCKYRTVKKYRGTSGIQEVDDYIFENAIITQEIYKRFNIFLIPNEPNCEPIRQTMTNEEVLKKIQKD